MPEPRSPLTFRTDVPPLAAPGWLAPDLAALNIELEPTDAEGLGRFLALLLAANEMMNLTAITEPDEAWRKHIFDALTLIPLLATLPEGAEVADVGSGGGVPAIPLAICLPSHRFTLIESTGKKAQFLNATTSALGLKNVIVLNERAEEIGQRHRDTHGREFFDAVLSRALGRMTVAAELTVPLAKPGGMIAFVKGEKADEELLEAKRALGVLGAAHVETIQTPTGRIVVLEKTIRTPRIYPREAGEPKRKPL